MWLCLRVFESGIVIISTCSDVLSVLLIISAPVRLTRGTFSLSFFLLEKRVLSFHSHSKIKVESFSVLAYKPNVLRVHVNNRRGL